MNPLPFNYTKRKPNQADGRVTLPSYVNAQPQILENSKMKDPVWDPPGILKQNMKIQSDHRPQMNDRKPYFNEFNPGTHHFGRMNVSYSKDEEVSEDEISSSR